MQSKQILNILFILLFSFGFASCKKYPENKGLLLSSPEARILRSYHLIKYDVDDEDSLAILSAKLNKDITSLLWDFRDKSHYYEIGSITGYGSYKFARKKKDLVINFTPFPQGLITLNIFMTGESTWEILKLDRKNLKLKRYYNGKKYILQFS